MGGRDMPAKTPKSKGMPKGLEDWIRIVPFNDAAAFERLLEAEGDKIAALIMEPVMMNVGIVLPQPGYLEKIRELCTKYGVVLIFDEVKCGVTIAAGGAQERFGVKPDLASWAKSIGGGAVIGAFGGRGRPHGRDQQRRGPPGHLQRQPAVGCGVARHAHPGPHARGLRALRHVGQAPHRRHERSDREVRHPGAHHRPRGQGCVSYRSEPLTNYRDFLDTNTGLYDASYPWMINRGVFMTPGDEEQWTMSVMHTTEHVDRYVDAFVGLCEALAA
jgi:glutamate-1-semialdehyde 2,1-aminomutase